MKLDPDRLSVIELIVPKCYRFCKNWYGMIGIGGIRLSGALMYYILAELMNKKSENTKIHTIEELSKITNPMIDHWNFAYLSGFFEP